MGTDKNYIKKKEELASYKESEESRKTNTQTFSAKIYKTFHIMVIGALSNP